MCPGREWPWLNVKEVVLERRGRSLVLNEASVIAESQRYRVTGLVALRKHVSIEWRLCVNSGLT